jgi:hypothetical protein
LTPGITLGYADLTLIGQEAEDMGYLTYKGKSKMTGEEHQIRVFNQNSKMAKENINKAITIFLRETLRLCALNKEVIIQDTLEFHENKLCYAIKPMSFPSLSKNSLEIPRMLEDLIEDLKYLTHCGIAQVSAAQIWKLGENSDKSQYFVQDWNQVLWKSQEKEEKKRAGPNNKMVDTTLASDLIEKENVCHLALGLLETFGLEIKGLELLLELGGQLYQKNIKLAVDEIVKEILGNNGKSYSDLLIEMLDASPLKRPSLEKIKVRVKQIREGKTNKEQQAHPFTQAQNINQLAEERKIESTQEYMSIPYQKLESAKLREYLEDPNPSSFHTIKLFRQNIGAEEVKYLSQNTTWVNLRELNVSYNPIGAEGAKYLSQNTSWINLQTLHFFSNSIGAEGAKYLGQNTSWINLRELNLYNNSIGTEGVKYLSQNMTWVNLLVLELAANSIETEGAKYLSQNTSWINLKVLGLASNSIGAEGAKYLSQNTTWVKLQDLNLAGNSIETEGAQYLSQNTSWINLKVLVLGINSIGAEGAKYLSQNTTWVKLQDLNLTGNSIGDEGAKYLNQNTTWINLKELGLNDISIGAEGAKYLSQNTTWINLEKVKLERNLIGEEGAKYLSQNTSWINLKELFLRENSVGPEGAKVLKARWSKERIDGI